MSCAKCEDQALKTYIRVDEANVMIVGCEKHLKRSIEIFRAGLEKEGVTKALREANEGGKNE